MKISFCTTCMNRLLHLKKTLELNLFDNDYMDLEFVILDYNSSDGLETYIKETKMDHIISGKLVYYKTFTPKYFERSKSRNIAFKLGSGEILCNLDADNFTGKNFASFLAKSFKMYPNTFLSPISPNLSEDSSDVLGRLCVKKEDFNAIGGFDERMIYYGFEDYDIVNRLMNSGIQRRVLLNFEYLRAITHSNEERLRNEFVTKNIRAILIRYLDPSKSVILYLFNDNTFKKGTLINNRALSSDQPYIYPMIGHDFSILNNIWQQGLWKESEETVELVFREHKNTVLKKNGVYYVVEPDSVIFYPLIGSNLVEQASFFYSQICNRIIMEDNRSRSMTKVNLTGYGHDVVFKNFDYTNPIEV